MCHISNNNNDFSRPIICRLQILQAQLETTQRQMQIDKLKQPQVQLWSLILRRCQLNIERLSQRDYQLHKRASDIYLCIDSYECRAAHICLHIQMSCALCRKLAANGAARSVNGAALTLAALLAKYIPTVSITMAVIPLQT